MGHFWIWFLAILGGTVAVVGIVWWLIQRSKKKKKKKSAGKKLPDKFYTKWGFRLTVVGLLVTIFFGVWGIRVSCRQDKRVIKTNGTDSLIGQQENKAPSRVDTVIKVPQGKKEGEPKDTVQVSDSSTLRTKDPKLDSTCTIIYLIGDPSSESEAQATQKFLLYERKSRFQQYPFKYYPLEPKDTSWFRTYYSLAKGGNEGVVPLSVEI